MIKNMTVQLLSGKYNDIQHYIKQIHPLAVYIHCSLIFSIWLYLLQVLLVYSIRNCLEIIVKVQHFFLYPKHKAVFSQCIEI